MIAIKTVSYETAAARSEAAPQGQPYMLAHIAERISALGPRFLLAFETAQAVDAQKGRKRAIEIAKEHEDLAFKTAMVAIVDVTLGLNIQTRANLITAKFPPNQRKFKKLQRELNKVLDCMADGLHEAAQRTKQLMDIIASIVLFLLIVYEGEHYFGV